MVTRAPSSGLLLLLLNAGDGSRATHTTHKTDDIQQTTDTHTRTYTSTDSLQSNRLLALLLLGLLHRQRVEQDPRDCDGRADVALRGDGVLEHQDGGRDDHDALDGVAHGVRHGVHRVQRQERHLLEI